MRLVSILSKRLAKCWKWRKSLFKLLWPFNLGSIWIIFQCSNSRDFKMGTCEFLLNKRNDFSLLVFLNKNDTNKNGILYVPIWLWGEMCLGSFWWYELEFPYFLPMIGSLRFQTFICGPFIGFLRLKLIFLKKENTKPSAIFAHKWGFNKIPNFRNILKSAKSCLQIGRLLVINFR